MDYLDQMLSEVFQVKGNPLFLKKNPSANSVHQNLNFLFKFIVMVLFWVRNYFSGIRQIFFEVFIIQKFHYSFQVLFEFFLEYFNFIALINLATLIEILSLQYFFYHLNLNFYYLFPHEIIFFLIQNFHQIRNGFCFDFSNKNHFVYLFIR